MKNKQIKVLFLSMAITAALAAGGCGVAGNAATNSSNAAGAATSSVSTEGGADASQSTSGGTSDDAQSTGTSDEAQGTTDDAAGEATSATTGTTSLVTSYADLDLANMFTDRDLENSYEEAGATKITLSGTAATVDGAGAQADGGVVTITKEGTYIVSGTLDDGQIIVETDDTSKVQIVLDDATITNDDSACILVKSADKVFVTTAEGTTNTLSDTGTAYTQETDEYNVDGVIFSRDDLVLNGSGTLVVNASYAHGIVGKDDIKITGGTIEVNAKDKGITANDSIRVADGMIKVTSGDDALHTSNGTDAGKGYIYIEGGSFDLAAGDDGIHAETCLVITDGVIDVTKSYEGLEGGTIDVEGGEITVAAQDDGMNAAISDGDADSASGTENDMFGGPGGGSMQVQADAYIKITGGTVAINATGDGLDSNGSIEIAGGDVSVEGSTADNSSLDYGASAVITGGTFTGAGSAGMGETLTSDSTQYAVIYNVGQTCAAGTTAQLLDADGKVVMEVTPESDYQSVIFSSADITDGTYTVKAGDASETVEVSSSVTTAGTAGGMMGGPGGGMQGRPGGGRSGNMGGAPEDMQGGSQSGPPQRPEGMNGGPGDMQENTQQTSKNA